MDLDGDGWRDVLSGSYSRDDSFMAGLFQVFWGRPGRSFRAPQPLAGTDGQPLIMADDEEGLFTDNICTRPVAVDWDADGDLDLAVGNFAGTFYLFTGEGHGRFRPKSQPILVDQEPLRVEGGHSDPFVVDWDSDGDLDLLSGASVGGVYWSENVAVQGQPARMKPFATLIEPGPPHEEGQIVLEERLRGPSEATRVWADDVDGDDKLDLLVGDQVTLVAPVSGIDEHEFREQERAWRKDLAAAAAARKETRDAQEFVAAQSRYRQVYERRAKFMREEMTGFVWLFRQK